MANHPALIQVDPAETNAEKRRGAERFARAAFTPQLAAQLRAGAAQGVVVGPGAESQSESQAGASSSSSTISNLYERSSNFWDLANAAHCGKLDCLDKLLTKFESWREKCLVFSWSTQTLDVIQAFLRSKGWAFTRLDGSTPVSHRQKLVDDFNNSKSAFIFLCSTRAGGVGINLQSASKVVVFDVNWNPSYDQQAQDRAYRIGQEKKVVVFRLISQGTIEELMYMRQLKKTSMTNATLDGKRSERIFEAIEGERKGELYGLANLMRFDPTGHLRRARVDSTKDDKDQGSKQCSMAAPASALTSVEEEIGKVPEAPASASAYADSDNEFERLHKEVIPGVEICSQEELVQAVSLLHQT